MNIKELLFTSIKASIYAGKEILKVYESTFSVETKDDKSPLTLADKESHQKIKSMLEETNIPILSEEGKIFTYEERKNWNPLWIVDPLDGTKEFIKRNGEFTVNIALIDQKKPVIGVIYVPVQNILYFGSKETGSYKLNLEQTIPSSLEECINIAQKLPISINKNTYVVVASRSHMSEETEAFINTLKKEKGDVALTSMGSSLKICLVAEGKADVYPRFAPTMEWDTAAGHAIVKFSGKQFIDYSTKQEMLYNRENLTNSWFLVQ